MPSAGAVPLVLASCSPARLATLRSAGVEPHVVVSDVDEELVLAQALWSHPDLDVADRALLLARAKSEAVVTTLNDATAPAGTPQGALVLGCDSMLELDGEAYGKPGRTDVARERWRRMRGRSGILHTGHWLVDTREPARTATGSDATSGPGGARGATVGVAASTLVRFARLSDAEIEQYVATGEPLQVAGGFTIDGLGGPFVTAIDGDPHNVVGLSLPVLRDLLLDIGVGWFDLVTPAP